MEAWILKIRAHTLWVLAVVVMAALNASAQTNIAIVGCNFDDGSGGWDKTPDDLDATDGISVSGWTHVGGSMNDAGDTGRASQPLATVRGDAASQPSVGAAPPTNGIHSFSITIPAAKSLALTKVEFDFSQSMGASQSGHNRWIAFRTSLDSTILFSEVGIWRPDLAHVSVDLSGSQYEKLSGQTVDVHWYNGGGATFGVDIDTIVISGVFSAKGTLITLH